jgi:hypothetical protein
MVALKFEILRRVIARTVIDTTPHPKFYFYFHKHHFIEFPELASQDADLFEQLDDAMRLFGFDGH